MRKTNRNDVIKQIEDSKIVVVMRKIPKEKLIDIADALYDGGIRVMEIAYCDDGFYSDTEVARQIRSLSEHFGERAVIGSGSTFNCEQVRLTKSAGGKFVISPNVDTEVIEETKKQGLVSIPGALTPTEIKLADKTGADFVKLFPVTSFGSEYVRAVKTPMSKVKFLVVGGITEQNIHEYMDCGIYGIGISSGILKKEFIERGDYESIKQYAQKYVNLVK